MATAKLFLDVFHPNKNGLYSIRLSIGHKSKKTSIKMPYVIDKDYWNGMQIKKNCPTVDNVRRANNDLVTRLKTANDLIDELTGSAVIKRMSVMDVKRLIEKKLDPNISLSITNDVIAYFEVFEKRKGAQNTRTEQIYRSTRNKIILFQKDKPLAFGEINNNWLTRFDTWMTENKLAVNARSIHFRNIRAVFNAAIDDDNLTGVTLNDYPFRKFKIAREKTAKRNFEADFLYKLYRKKKLENKTARDLFFLIFFLVGINIIDLYFLAGIEHGRINYKRRKGGKNYSIKVEPEAMRIIKKYRGKDHLLFWGDKWKSHNTFKKFVIKQMQALSEELGIHLTTYYARHSWASIARNIGVSKDDIRSALGHGDNTVTDIYINLDRDLIDEANRKVIDEVTKKKPAGKPAGTPNQTIPNMESPLL